MDRQIIAALDGGAHFVQKEPVMYSKPITAALLLVGLSLAPALTVAANGAIPINQACVATGCFDGDTAGFPVRISAPGHYILTSNLVVSGSNSGVSISAAGTMLDLNGFAILGENTCTGTPVTDCTEINASGSGISSGAFHTLRNGRVSGFYIGLACQRGCELVNVQVDNNSREGMNSAYGGNTNGVIIRNSLFERNGGFGVRPSAKGNLIENSVFRYNKTQGLETGGSGLFRNSVVGNNGTFSRFNTRMLITGSTFDETATSNGSPYTGGRSAGDNLCNDSIC